MTILTSKKPQQIGKLRHQCKRPFCEGILIKDRERIICLCCGREYDENGELVKTINPKAEKVENSRRRIRWLR